MAEPTNIARPQFVLNGDACRGGRPKARGQLLSDGSVLRPATGVSTLLCRPDDPNPAHQTDVGALEQAAEIFTMLPAVLKADRQHFVLRPVS